MATHNVKNTDNGIRGFRSTEGLVELAPGQVATGVEISAHEYAAAKRTGWFEMDGEPDKADEGEAAPADDLDTTVPKLRDIAKAEGVDLAGMTSKADIQGAIRIARTAKSNGSGNDAIDAMDDATLRSTVQAITGKSEADVADLDRPALLALARGEG